MRIIFDTWLINQERMKNLTFEEERLYEAMFNFAYDKLYHLDEEIEREEALNEGTAIIFEILRKRISFKDYSDTLTEKMKNSFQEEDNELLTQYLDQAFAYLN